MPSRSEMKKSDRLSGVHCGLMFLPLVNARTCSIVAARRIDQREAVCADVERRRGRDEKRSVANAMRVPSGDQAGCRSANGSLVSRAASPVPRSSTNRVGQPAAHPGEAIALPSGAHVGLKISSSSAIGDLALLVAARASKIASAGAAAVDRGDRDPLARRVPRAGRINELQAREVRIGRRARQLAQHLPVSARRRTDRSRRRLRSDRNAIQLAVRADRRADVEVAAEPAAALTTTRPTSAGGRDA